MSAFELNPPSLTFDNETPQTQFVRLNGRDGQFYALGHGHVPPSIIVSYTDYRVGDQQIAIRFNPNASHAPMTGNIQIRLEIGCIHSTTIHTAHLPITFVTEYDRDMRYLAAISPNFLEMMRRYSPQRTEEDTQSVQDLGDGRRSGPSGNGGVLECTICCSDFDEGLHLPKILTCGHTFCNQCLTGIERSHIRPTPFLDDRQAYACPIDRQPITQTAFSIPRNRIVLDMLQERKEQNANKIAYTPKFVRDAVVPCVEDQNHESAVYCKMCEEPFCDACYKSIHSSKVLSRHKSIPVSEKPLVLPMCPLHKDNVAEFICTDEDCEVGHINLCKTCLKTDHIHHAHKPVQLTINANIDYFQDDVTHFETAEVLAKHQIKQVDNCSPGFNRGNRDYQKARCKIIDDFERKRKAALDKFDDWAAEKKQKLAMEKTKRQEILEDIQKSKLKCKQTLLRKTDLHKELTDKEVGKKKLNEVKAMDIHFFSIDEYTIDPDFKTMPASPIILNCDSSPPHSPGPQLQAEVKDDPAAREIEEEQRQRDEDEVVDLDDFEILEDDRDADDEEEDEEEARDFLEFVERQTHTVQTGRISPKEEEESSDDDIF